MSEERGDGGGTEFERVLEELRTRIADGTYAVGSQLPVQRELAEELNVSRDTVQRVIREMNSEGWIKSRQGSGTRVVKSPAHAEPPPKEAAPRVRAALGTFIARAFAQPVVQLDVSTLTSETLDAHIRLQVERIRLGEIRPESVKLRMLLPSETMEHPYPRAKQGEEPRQEPGQPDRLQQRLHAITRRHTASVRIALLDLKSEGLVPEVDVEIQHVPVTPTFKLYLRPGVEALFGPYAVVERTILLDDLTEVEALDVLGWGAPLTRHVNDEGDPDAPGSVFMTSMQVWFDSYWNLLAEGL
ncbi:GntR family transcriptional regulator [Streptomyces sp. RG80]|uniref:GntR family transcriptional regulator n=1 Tax=Streptomyces sp. RG80 TaxID=3157340 RepID=UPI00338D6E86